MLIQSDLVVPGDLMWLDGCAYCVIRLEPLHILEWNRYQHGSQSGELAVHNKPNIIKFELCKVMPLTREILNIFRGWHELVNIPGKANLSALVDRSKLEIQ